MKAISGRWLVSSALLGLLVATCSAEFQRQQYNSFQNQLQTQNFRVKKQYQPQNQLVPQTNQYQQNNDIQQQQQQQQQLSASCPERNGRFPVPSQCDAFIECVDGVGEQKLCPEGLMFNPEVRFNYPCGYPIDVKCEGRSALQPAQPTEECPHQYGYFKMGDRNNCGQFMNCVDGKSFVFDCPEGLAFNSDTYCCDWPDQVADCDPEAFLGFTCPTGNQNSFLSPAVRFYRSPNDCQHYYTCLENNQPRLLNCGEGYAFNELIGACDVAENVTGCASSPSHKNSVDEYQIDARSGNDLRSYNSQQQKSFNQQQYRQQNSFVAPQQQSFDQQKNSFNRQQNVLDRRSVPNKI